MSGLKRYRFKVLFFLCLLYLLFNVITIISPDCFFDDKNNKKRLDVMFYKNKDMAALVSKYAHKHDNFPTIKYNQNTLYIDENFHSIRTFVIYASKANFVITHRPLDKNQTSTCGYNVIMAFILKLLGPYGLSIFALRTITFILALLLAFVAKLLLEQIYIPETIRCKKWTEILLCPLYLPFYFLIYPSIMALTICLFSLYCFIKKKHLGGALVLFLACWIHQTSLALVGIYFLYLFLSQKYDLHKDNWRRNIGQLKQLIGEMLPYFISAMLFVCSILLYRGTIFDPPGISNKYHEGVSLLQIYTYLLFIGIIFLPYLYDKIKEGMKRIICLDRTMLLHFAVFLILTVMAFYILPGVRIGATHRLRYALLRLIMSNPLTFITGALFVFLVLYAYLIKISREKNKAMLLASFWGYLPALFWNKAIDPRYYFLPVAFILLFKRQALFDDRVYTCWYICLGLIVMGAMMTNRFFL